MPKALIAGPAAAQEKLNYRNVALSGLGIIALLFVGFAIWAHSAPLGAAVHAQGEMTFDTKRKTVQHLEGGIVKQILVREGDTVKAGQPLVVLEDEQIRPMVEMLDGQSLAESATMARLEAERKDLGTIAFPSSILSRAKEPEVARVMQTEIQLLNARRANYQVQVDVLKSQIQQVREETKGLKDQLLEKKKEIGSLSEELTGSRELLKGGYVTRTMIRDQERIQSERSGERDLIAASIARNQERLAELEVRISGMKNAHLQEVVADMKQASAKRLDLQERVRPARNSMERGVLRAPVSGKVVDLRVTTVGGVIGGREPLMDIVPASDHLVLEAKIGINDIHDVQVGQTAEVTLTAFKASTTPPVMGKVTYISADRLLTRTMQGDMPYYAVRLELDPQSLKSAGDLQLYPGMAAQVVIATKARTAYDYFIGPFQERLGKAFREK